MAPSSLLRPATLALLANEAVTGEAILGVFGALTSVGAQGWHRFNQQGAYDSLRLRGREPVPLQLSALGFDESETSLGVDGGVGIQADLRQLFDSEDFPPITLGADVGLGVASFDAYGSSAFAAGSGLHYF